MTAPVLAIDGVTKTYRMGEVEVHALRGVDLTLPAGEFVTLIGPSGSGPTPYRIGNCRGQALAGCLSR